MTIDTLYYNHLMRKILILCLTFLTACSSRGPNSSPNSVTVKPYLTMTSTATASQPNGLVVSVTTPLPSPTPFTYTVKSGDTLGQIAQKFNVSLFALTSANPNVDPNAMSIGQTLKIPSQQNSTGAQLQRRFLFLLNKLSVIRRPIKACGVLF